MKLSLLTTISIALSLPQPTNAILAWICPIPLFSWLPFCASYVSSPPSTPENIPTPAPMLQPTNSPTPMPTAAPTPLPTTPPTPMPTLDPPAPEPECVVVATQQNGPFLPNGLISYVTQDRSSLDTEFTGPSSILLDEPDTGAFHQVETDGTASNPPDGSIDTISTFNRDSNGRLLDVVFVSLNETTNTFETTSTTTYSYNSMDQLILIETIDATGNIFSREFRYDANGNRVSIVYNTTVNPTFVELVVSISYGANGLPSIVEEDFASESVNDNRDTYIYDDDGTLLRREREFLTTIPEFRSTFLFVYEYDMLGRLIKELRDRESDGTFDSAIHYVYEGDDSKYPYQISEDSDNDGEIDFVQQEILSIVPTPCP